jgi:hypothetical protein
MTGNTIVGATLSMLPRAVGHPVESAWGAVPGLLLARLPRPLAEPGVPVSGHRTLHGFCHQAWLGTQGLGIVLSR